jgi:hypothetical protein
MMQSLFIGRNPKNKQKKAEILYIRSGLILFLILLLFSCSGHDIVKDFGVMFKLRDSLKKVYPNEKIQLNISNDTYISISFINSKLRKSDPREKKIMAENVGRITRHFFTEERIPEGHLVYAVYYNIIIFKYSETIDIYDLWPQDSVKQTIDIKQNI